MSEEDSNQPDSLRDFEQSLNELETLVEALEQGNIGLQEALSKFERGVALARSCQDALKTAELRIAQLSREGDSDTVTDFDLPGDDAEP